MSFREQSGPNVIRVEDEHPLVSAPLLDNLALILDEAPEMRESHLHSLIDDMSDQHQILCYCRGVQDVHQFSLLLNMVEGDFTDMLDGMWGVVSGFVPLVVPVF